VGERLCRSAAVCSLLTAGFLFAFLVTISPHLVRHAFEEHDHHHGPPTCPLLIQSQLTHAEPEIGAVPGVPTLAVGLVPERLPTADPPAPSVHAVQPRAPPPA
jgi:hypothetical protein